MNFITKHKGISALTLCMVALTSGLYGNSTMKAPAGAQLKTQPSNGHWILEGDALAWKAVEDGLTYGYSYNDKDIDDQPIPRVLSKYHSFELDWNAGFRVITGYEFKGHFELTGAWTRFTSDADAHQREDEDDFEDGGKLFFPTWDYNESFVDKYEAHLSLTLNVLDVEFARRFIPVHNFSLKPSIGVRAAWIDQKIHTKSQFSGFLQEEDDLEKINMENNFAGAGPRAGLDMEWNLGKNFSLFGTADISVLWGSFEVEYKNKIFADLNDAGTFDPSDLVFNAKQEDHYAAVRAITDLGLGFRWKKYFRDERSIFTVQVGWEQHIFFNQNRFEEFHQLDSVNPSFNRGDLMTSGVTFGLRLDY